MTLPRSLAVLLLVCCPVLARAQATTAKPDPAGPMPPAAHAAAIQDATVLVDAGRFDEAIAALKPLAADPRDETAVYELGLAYAAKGDHRLCIETLEPLADHAGSRQTVALGMLGNCQDSSGDHDKAIRSYRRGLAITPNDAKILFNLALTLAQQGKLDDARSLLKQATKSDPAHASSHFLLAQVFAARGFTVPAVFSYLRFLALEPVSTRGSKAAQALQDLLNGNVTKTAKGANITIDPGGSKEEGDYMGMQIALAMSSAVKGTESEARMTEFEKSQHQVVDVIKIFLELGDRTAAADYTNEAQRPFFVALRKENLLEPFAAVALSTLHEPGLTEWANANEKEVDRYVAWMRPWLQATPVAIPVAPRP